MTNVLQYLEQTALRLPDKLAFSDGNHGLTFGELSRQAKAIGSFLLAQGIQNSPVAVYMKKSPQTIAAFFGVLYSGNYYVPLDPEMPKYRVDMILSQVQPKATVCGGDCVLSDCFLYEDICQGPIEENALAEVRQNQLDTDPIYIVFTSGSTGIPKGVTACHRCVIDYVEALSSVLGFDESAVFGNQAPLYFDACLKELFPTCKFGATTYLIPKGLFSFPVKLVEYLNQYEINTLCWVVSALTTVSALGTFRTVTPKFVRTIAFAGEVFPMKQLILWREALPQTRFFNLYGPTETTGICCYYEVDRDFSPEEALPIGRPLPNTGILLINDRNQPASPGEPGEICIRGTCLTLGYYNDPQRTAEAFVQNPLNALYPERIYRTGDYGFYNDRRELMFLSRKDHQIKHMGHRIELGEIEAAAMAQTGVHHACCLFNSDKKKLILCYAGTVSVPELASLLKNALPRYMLPQATHRMDALPLTPNGKINRTELQRLYLEN